MAAQFAADLEAIFSREHDVKQNQVEGGFTGACRGRVAIGDSLDLVAFHAQIVFEAKCNSRFILHDQNASHARPTPGKSMVNVDPHPGWLATWMRPRCAATMWRTMANPTPDPLTLPSAAALPRTNLRKIFLRSDSTIPGPRSRTRIAT